MGALEIDNGPFGPFPGLKEIVVPFPKLSPCVEMRCSMYSGKLSRRPDIGRPSCVLNAGLSAGPGAYMSRFAWGAFKAGRLHVGQFQ